MSNPLIGKTIMKVEVTDVDDSIRFTCSDGSVITAYCYGDCCSSTWIENVENPEVLIGSPVLTAEDVGSMKEDEEVHGFEYIAFYGFQISTLKGRCDIDYRNSSNGYYGGSLNFEQVDDGFVSGWEEPTGQETWKVVAQ